MKNTKKAVLSSNIRKVSIINLAIVITISLIGIAMAIFSIANAKYLYTFLYLIAATMGILYAVIKINSVFPTAIWCDGQTFCFTTWDNGLFAFDIDKKPVFLADFFPAKVKSYKIPLDNINKITIGSKAFIIRTTKDTEFEKKILSIETKSKRISRMIKRLDIMYIGLDDGKMYYMCVNDYDIDLLYEVISKAEHSAQGITINTNIYSLRKKMETASVNHRT